MQQLCRGNFTFKPIATCSMNKFWMGLKNLALHALVSTLYHLFHTSVVCACIKPYSLVDEIFSELIPTDALNMYDQLIEY